MENAAFECDWVDGYLADWEKQDIDSILARHTDDSIFTSAAFGRYAEGPTAIREALQTIFAIWPDLRFRILRRYQAPEFIACETIAEATQAVPLELAGHMIKPNGRTVRFAICDIFAVRDERIARKDSYVDGLGYLAAMTTQC